MADQFDRNHQWRHQHNRPHKMLQILHNSMLPDSGVVVIHENEDGTPRRNIGIAGRGTQSRDQSKNIGKGDKNPKGTNDWKELMTVVSDVFFKLAFQKFNGEFRRLLK